MDDVVNDVTTAFAVTEGFGGPLRKVTMAIG